jgi:hypothetical protein
MIKVRQPTYKPYSIGTRMRSKPQPKVTLPPEPVRKYDVNYTPTGDILYAGQPVGNVLQTNIFDIGEDAWLENWAIQNGVALQPNPDWVPEGDLLLPAKDSEIDMNSSSLLKTFGASENDLDKNKGGISGAKSLLPLTPGNSVRGLEAASLDKWSEDKNGYGRGFEADSLSPFLRK